MELPRKQTLINQVKDYLRNEIINGVWLPGQRLEPVRRLTIKLNVSHVTVATAMKELADEGWIETKVGRGAFVGLKLPVKLPDKVSKPQINTGKNLYFFFVHDPGYGSYHSEVLCQLQREAEQYGWNLKVGMFADSNALELAQRDPAAVGIVHAKVERACNVESHVPVINYGMDPSFPGSCCVSPDNYQAGFSAGRLLWEKGYRQAVFVTVAEAGGSPDMYPQLNFEERYWGVVDFYRAQGITLPPPLPWSLPQNVCEPVELLLRQVKTSKTAYPALAVGNRVMAAEICQLAARLGLEIPRDLSIITFVCRGGMDMAFPLSTFDFSREEMGSQIALMLRQAAAGKPLPSRVLLSMYLHDEGSVANCSI